MRTLTFLFLLLPLYMFGGVNIIASSSILGNWLFYEELAIIDGEFRTYSLFQQSGNEIESNLVNKGHNKAFYVQQKSLGTILIGPRMNNLETVVLKRNDSLDFKNYECVNVKQPFVIEGIVNFKGYKLTTTVYKILSIVDYALNNSFILFRLIPCNVVALGNFFVSGQKYRF